MNDQGPPKQKECSVGVVQEQPSRFPHGTSNPLSWMLHTHANLLDQIRSHPNQSCVSGGSCVAAVRKILMTL
jgi:hypothetical protein